MKTSQIIAPLLTLIAMVEAAQAVSPDIVISQVYGGGGNSGAEYTNDFIELFNRGTEAVDLTGWSVQYASSAGTSWANRTNLSGMLQPGRYYLIQGVAGAGGTVPLPTPDATGTINLSGTSGKVAVVNSTVALVGSNPDPATYIDFVGYGAANYFEGGAAAPTASNTLAVLRVDGGCQDTDQNGNDFTAGAPAPRNTASPSHTCAVVPTLEVRLTTVALDSPTELRIEGTVNAAATLTLEFATDLTGWMAETSVAPKAGVVGPFLFQAPFSGNERFYRVSAAVTP